LQRRPNATNIPFDLLQRWMGHARSAATAIYLDVSGPEEREIAGRFWRS
jgi:integrase/recombinase XerD